MPFSRRSGSTAEAGRGSRAAAAPDPGVLEQRLGYRFEDPALLRRALTHKSAGADNFERFEFLGDAALGCVVAHRLFDAMPDASEHRLTLMRASLVKSETLTAVAREIGLDDFLTVGTGVRESGGAERSSILADALEAVLGAVLRDGGMNAVAATVERLFAARLAIVGEAELKDPKTRLQERLQGRKLPLPRYGTVAVGGADHLPEFTAECIVADLSIRARATGRTRQEAEKRAAALVLERLEES